MGELRNRSNERSGSVAIFGNGASRHAYPAVEKRGQEEEWRSLSESYWSKITRFFEEVPSVCDSDLSATYSWTEKECRQLWVDILRADESDDISAHFIGSVAYVEKDLYSISSQSPLLVIDGQQRLTTVSLLIVALVSVIGEGEPIESFSNRKLRNYYLLNPEEEGERHFELILSQTDKSLLIAILEDALQPKEF